MNLSNKALHHLLEIMEALGMKFFGGGSSTVLSPGPGGQHFKLLCTA